MNDPFRKLPNLPFVKRYQLKNDIKYGYVFLLKENLTEVHLEAYAEGCLPMVSTSNGLQQRLL